MRAVSTQRAIENRERRKAMAIVRQRDGNRCVGAGVLPGRCYGALNGHEIITRSDGGSITDSDNIVLLCNHHNEWCDLHAAAAVSLGFRQIRHDPYSSRVARRLPHLSPGSATA